jgi:uncharacterized protein YijF (DUF1287 family)
LPVWSGPGSVLKLLTGADAALFGGLLSPPLVALLWSIAGTTPAAMTELAAAPSQATVSPSRASGQALPQASPLPTKAALPNPEPLVAQTSIEVAALDASAATPVETLRPVTELSIGAGAADLPVIATADHGQRLRRCSLDEPGIGSPLPALSVGDAATPFGERLARAAERQLDDFVVYTDDYTDVPFPMGDVPALYGVCTDVVIRAYRSVGIDLQGLVHQSRVGSGDASIDHRRTEVLRRFFAVHGGSLPISDVADDYLPGDIVTYFRPQNYGSQSHIAVVSNRLARSGRPMIVHNRGWGPQLEDALFVDQITGHYRYSGSPTVMTALPPPSYPAPRQGSSRSFAGSASSSVVLKSRRVRAALIRQRIEASRARLAKSRVRAERKIGAIVR